MKTGPAMSMSLTATERLSELYFSHISGAWIRVLVMGNVQVVTEIEEPFVPQPDDLIVNLEESRGVVDALLTNLPQMFASSLSSEAATGPALKAAFLAMSSIGGKLLLFQAAVPSLGKDPHPAPPYLFGEGLPTLHLHLHKKASLCQASFRHK